MKNIGFTAAYWHEIKEKIDVYNELENILNSFDLCAFNQELFKLLIVFQCFPKDTKSRKVEEYKIQRRKTSTLELYLVLNYERIIQGSDEENLTYIKEVFLKGCETFLKPQKGFKWEGFEAKMKELL